MMVTLSNSYARMPKAALCAVLKLDASKLNTAPGADTLLLGTDSEMVRPHSIAPLSFSASHATALASACMKKTVHVYFFSDLRSANMLTRIINVCNCMSLPACSLMLTSAVDG